MKGIVQILFDQRDHFVSDLAWDLSKKNQPEIYKILCYSVSLWYLYLYEVM